VNDVAYLVIGCLIGMAATRLWRKATPGTLADETDPEIQSQPQQLAPEEDSATPAKIIETAITPSSESMALSMATELANLVSAVEGRAHHLIEAAPSRTNLPQAAEGMLTSIRRLRRLHTKLVAVGRGRPVGGGSTDVIELIASLGDELQQMQLGLELRWDPPETLPRIDACPQAMHDALLFLCSSLLQAERGAMRLTVSVERSFASDRPALIIELNLEWINSADSERLEPLSEPAFTLDLEAAKYLIQSHGGELMLSHLPGKSVQAVAQLPMAIAQEAPVANIRESVEVADAENSDATNHQFGGTLVLESDPAIRAVLARELKASGRAVFACADGASAHTFLQATPDRFELLILDDVQQLDEHTPLARTIRQHTPQLKICLITPSPGNNSDFWPDMHCLQKPFGVHELRRKLASILSAG
jgi:CheY-like chemotaxis protein